MLKYLIIIYGLIGYLIGLITLLYMVGWLYPWSFMPTNIDNGNTQDIILSITIDTTLILLFGIQHSLMVRASFKRWIERYFSSAGIRVTYTIVSSIFLALIMIFWQPIDIKIWNFENGLWYWFFTILYFVGWGVAIISTFLIDHFALFGLHQAYKEFKAQKEPKSSFQIRGFYKFVRHPIQAGTILGIWATPQMSLGHLLFAIIFTIYIMIGLYFEERDLIKEFGKKYEEYRARVPMLFPFLKRNSKKE